MTHDSFLSSVAAYFAAGVEGRPSVDTLVYVLPNKRSAMFLKKYVREQVRGSSPYAEVYDHGQFYKHIRRPARGRPERN